MDIIVDGYNLIGAEQGLTGSLEAKRNRLVQRLSIYRRIKRFHVTLVFDGWRSGAVEETVQSKDGVSVVYSRLGEKADAVIVRLARAKSAGSVVVSSDREIRTSVERFGAIAVSSDEFSGILRSVENGYEDDDSEESLRSNKSGSKRGSKTERRREEKLKKLRL